jgi:hypothetical protein
MDVDGQLHTLPAFFMRKEYQTPRMRYLMSAKAGLDTLEKRKPLVLG